jgi:hypothetical protein
LFLGSACYAETIDPKKSCLIIPKYAPGDRLWVREAWGICAYSNESGYEISVRYKADNKEKYDIEIEDEEQWERYANQEETRKSAINWRPSIFLPHAAARLFLDVKTVSIERLHELDDAEALLEGFKNREEFISYWNKLNLKRGFPWELNPWVYRIEFEKAQK